MRFRNTGPWEVAKALVVLAVGAAIIAVLLS
jgi:hypothetical protein